jgi:hypothetical protein
LECGDLIVIDISEGRSFVGAIKVKVAMTGHDNARSSARKSWGIISNIKEMIWGSVSEYVIRHGKKPVLAVKR